MHKVLMAMVVTLAVSAVVAMANCGNCPGDKPAAAGKVAMECKGMALYACAHCKTVAMEAGKCGMCNMDMVKMRVLECKDGMAKLCSCASDCKCGMNAKDPAQCSCGKDVISVSVKNLKCCEGCKAPDAKTK